MKRDSGARLIDLGRIIGLYGVRGWVKVFSETDPRENILGYTPWCLGGSEPGLSVVDGQRQGKGVIARLAGIEDRDAAASLVGRTIAVRRDQLPPPSADEFYWVDLEGLAVTTEAGQALGRIERLFATAANDVVVVRGDRERLIPFVWGGVIKDVDFAEGRMVVDWDPDF